MVGNPKKWLCEGVLQKNPDGSIDWMTSGTTTTTPPWPVPGLPIDIYSCIDSPGAFDNNVDNIAVVIPASGGGLLTSTCLDEGHTFGAERDCEFTFTKENMLKKCTPGAQVTLKCSIPNSAASQVLRVCESSIKLQTGTACRYNDAWTLANTIILPNVQTSVSFKCPTARDKVEVGGFYSLYSGAELNGIDSNAVVTCN